MQILDIGAALALAQQIAGQAQAAAQAANAAAQAANNAAGAANTAATNANTAAASYAQLSENEIHSRVALNMMYTILQAEQRSDDKRITTLESKVSALT